MLTTKKKKKIGKNDPPPPSSTSWLLLLGGLCLEYRNVIETIGFDTPSIHLHHPKIKKPIIGCFFCRHYAPVFTSSTFCCILLTPLFCVHNESCVLTFHLNHTFLSPKHILVSLPNKRKRRHHSSFLFPHNRFLPLISCQVRPWMRSFDSWGKRMETSSSFVTTSQSSNNDLSLRWESDSFPQVLGSSTLLHNKADFRNTLA